MGQVWPSFVFNDTATTEIYTLSLHDALPIYDALQAAEDALGDGRRPHGKAPHDALVLADAAALHVRSEEHTSELQSQSNLVCRLLLGKNNRERRCGSMSTSEHLAQALVHDMT